MMVSKAKLRLISHRDMATPRSLGLGAVPLAALGKRLPR